MSEKGRDDEQDDGPFPTPLPRKLCEPHRLWNRHDVACYLNMSERWVWRLTRGGKIPCLRVGESYRYDQEEIRRWVKAGHAAGLKSRGDDKP